ncbi:ATP synthase F1 subunit gamma [Metaclostridioides mangenotii]|uniref:ATP synthase F1 subunit gamma n=1 Tax=Metaclostridioides mangenotii TaxID=1540 RepID=UPI0028E95C4F|nr:ATP synthase F1 subunit gamma [Clostridioides mangenotii]
MAGAGIKAIKTRMVSVESTKQITKAMELVASSKLRKAKERAESTEPYFDTLYDTVKDIASTTRVNNVFMKQREVKNRCYVVVAGDRGLAGGYNSNVLKETVSHMDGKKETVMTIGKKAYEFFSKRDYNVAGYVEAVEGCTYADTSEISNKLMDLYKKGEVDEVYFAYTKFKSALVQEVKLIKLLPLVFEDEALEEKKSRSKVQYLPSPGSVLNYIIPNYVAGVVYGGIIESFASEQGARRTAMESATDNANEMLSDLELSYNRARQSAVTQEITEIVGGVEALK